jgi:hypothetical protein
MKKIALFVLAIIAFACGEKKTETTETTEAKEWKQMDDFHLIMAEAFHPYKDSANLAPAKQMAEDMAISAVQWLDAELPEKVRNDEMKANLKQLNIGSQDLLKLVVDDAADSLIAKSLTDLHDTFHKIQEGWYGGGKKEGEGHEHH